MSDTDELLEYLKGLLDIEVDHAFSIYKIQDIYNGDVQTKITLVKDD